MLSYLALSLVALGSSYDTIETGEWLAGVHYTILAPSQEKFVKSDKVEVLEFFQYTSPISRAIQPYLQDWVKKRRNIVEYIRKPAIWLPHTHLQGRMYLTLKELTREDLHLPFFDWVFEPKHYRIYHRDYIHPDEKACLELNLSFAKTHRLDEDKFLEIYNSPNMDAQITFGAVDGLYRHIYGTSTIVINGKYSTSLQRFPSLHGFVMDMDSCDIDKFFKLIDYLVNSEIEKRNAVSALADPDC